ncbi:metallophosphoesterase family protein [Nannocystis punicea]|uniref:Phosphoesterase n=1 Tax=Nannocystis punicea TaxID=2995304 RepID=A0ABY7GWD6_9BACT|nr:metallophosphoesterase family protein [Nannocystis poenicansa]WAS91246.1 metallophosphoesterase family protein [Nannocystis poenicansa]
MAPPEPVVVGVISDTHGLVRPEALAALAGVDHIVHAGDVGGQAVFDALAAIAPVTVVRGNNDRDRWGRSLPETAEVRLGGARIYAIHDLAELAVDPRAAGIAVVVSGHSHKPAQSYDRDVLYLNPGSAGPRRFKLPICLAKLHLGAGAPAVEFVDLVPPARAGS